MYYNRDEKILRALLCQLFWDYGEISIVKERDFSVYYEKLLAIFRDVQKLSRYQFSEIDPWVLIFSIAGIIFGWMLTSATQTFYLFLLCGLWIIGFFLGRYFIFKIKFRKAKPIIKERIEAFLLVKIDLSSLRAKDSLKLIQEVNKSAHKVLVRVYPKLK